MPTKHTPNTNCVQCGALFYATPYEVTHRNKRFCSPRCFGIASRNPTNRPLPNPSGKCQCGCGETTPLARCSSAQNGWVKGEHIRFMNRHGRRMKRRILPEYYAIDPDTGCWNWLLYKDKTGYGRVGHNGHVPAAHRVSWIEHRGPIPNGLQVDHLCFNRGCVNPDHLEPVTPAENTRRRRVCKLTPESVRQIHELRASGVPLKAIAQKFGLNWRYVSNVLHGWSWKEFVHDDTA